jgi:hypothetical protein
MRSRQVLLGALLVLLPFLDAGCMRQSFSYGKSVWVDPADAYQEVIVEAPTSSQNVTVEISSDTVPVNVYLVLAKDEQAAQQSLSAGKAPANVLDQKQKVQTATLSATIPAQNGYMVLVSPTGGKKTMVQVKITGH